MYSRWRLVLRHLEMHALQFIHTPTAVKNPTDLLWEPANKHRSLPDDPLSSPSLSSFFPFLPSLPASPRNFFSLEEWSQWKIWVQARPSLQSHGLRIHTHTHTNTCVHSNRAPSTPSTPCQMNTPRLHLSASFQGSASLHPETLSKVLPNICPQGALCSTRWHCVSACFRGKRGVKISPSCFYVQVRSGRLSEPDVGEILPPPSSTEILLKENRKFVQDVHQLLFIKFDEIIPVYIYSRLHFLTFYMALVR